MEVLVQPDLCFIIVMVIVTIYIIIIVMGVLVVQPDLCRSSGETPLGAPAMAVIVIILNHDRRHQNHDRHQKHDIHQKHHLHQKYNQNPTIIITDKSPPWWDSVMVGISWVTMMIVVN